MKCFKNNILISYHFANVGSVSVTTRNIYRAHVNNLKTKSTIRIRKPGNKKKIYF